MDAKSNPSQTLHGRLREQECLIARLERLGVRQDRLVRDDNVEAVRSLLTERERLLEELTAVIEACAELRRSIGQQSPKLGEEENEDLSASNKVRLRRLLAAGEQDLRVLSVRKKSAGDALRALHDMQSALIAYGGCGPRPSGFADTGAATGGAGSIRAMPGGCALDLVEGERS